MSDPPAQSGFTPPPLLSNISKPAMLSQANSTVSSVAGDARPLSTGSVGKPAAPPAATKKKNQAAPASKPAAPTPGASNTTKPTLHTEEAIKNAGAVAISALSEVSSS